MQSVSKETKKKMVSLKYGEMQQGEYKKMPSLSCLKVLRPSYMGK